MSRRDWYRDHEGPAEEHAVDIEVQTRLKDDPEYQELRAQVLELGGMLGHLLDGEALDLWLRVETAINDRWAMFAEDAYNVGVDAGLAMRVVDEVLAQARVDAPMQPAAAVRALAAALARIAERLS
jgi:hypothetical protein